MERDTGGPDGPPPAEWDADVIEYLRNGDGSRRLEDLVARFRDPSADPAPVPEATVAYERLVADVLPRLVRDGRVVYAPEGRTVTLLTDDATPPWRGFEPEASTGLVVFASLLLGLGLGPLIGFGTGVGLGVAALVGTGVHLYHGFAPQTRPKSPDEPPAPSRNDRPRTPESRTLELLLAEGGVVEQRAVADRLDCSKSTVSRRLSRLEGAGLVEKVSAGQTKVVFLRGVAPADPVAERGREGRPAIRAGPDR
jgi:hypothetical protein